MNSTLKYTFLIALGLSTCAFSSCSHEGNEKPNQPNVIFINADDLGYGDLGCYGATKVKTPNIDKLAQAGKMFTDAHSASAVCTPSRYALLTGQYPMRASNGKGIWGPSAITSELLIAPDQLTIADVFKRSGYSTAAIGKWHLGFGVGENNWQKPLSPGPNDLGFDYYYGVPIVNSAPPFVYVENDHVVGGDPTDPLVYLGKGVHEDATAAHQLYNDYTVGTVLAEKAVNFITAKATEKSPQEEQNLSENTLVIFTSDNGAMLNLGGRNAVEAGHKINGDLLGFKFGAWEGGHRIPFIAKWPRKIEAGSSSDQLICNVDMLATFMALLGQDSSPSETTDSKNILPALLGNPKEPIRDELLLAPRKEGHLSLRKGKWMYIPAQGSGGFKGSKPDHHAWGRAPAVAFMGGVNSDIEHGEIKEDAPPAQLYNLEKDKYQTTNLYHQHPEIVKEMEARLKEIVNQNKKD